MNFSKSFAAIYILLLTVLYAQSDSGQYFFSGNQKLSFGSPLGNEAKTSSNLYSNYGSNKQSLLKRINPDSTQNDYDRSFLRVGAEILGGAFSGFLLYTPTVLLSATRKGIPDNAVPAILASYSIGAGLGVYLIARGGNDSLSLWSTLAASTIGGGLSLIPPLLSSDPGDVLLTIFILPVISAVIYANLIAPYPGSSQEPVFSAPGRDQNINEWDIYNSSISYRINLFRINF